MNNNLIKIEDKPEWLKARLEVVTSTEIGALFGVSPYKTEFELWYEKKDKQIIRIVENNRMTWGNRLEPVIAKGIADDNNWIIEKANYFISNKHLKIGASFDFFILDEKGIPNQILEIKNVDSLVFKNQWLKEGNDIQAPDHIEIQVQLQLLVTNFECAYIGVLAGGNDIHLIKRFPDREIQKAIVDKAKSFWTSIDNNSPPNPDFHKDAEFIKQLYFHAEPGTLLETDDLTDLVKKYKNYSKMEKESSEEKEAVKAEILTRIGTYEKVKGSNYSISAGIVGATVLNFERKAYRSFKVYTKGESND